MNIIIMHKCCTAGHYPTFKPDGKVNWEAASDLLNL